tara:strand:- start:5665 stop:6123 length:459 start_codon:yes stop_codon:yes gene_type:complete
MIKSEAKRYKNSQRGLNQLLRLYERNYRKLIKFFPISETDIKIEYLIPEGNYNSEIKISCKNLSLHTSIIEIKKSKSISLIDDTEIEIYLYHDAKLAEVRKFNGKKQFWLRNKYPNKNMLSKDEKFQWNFFLEEFLTHTKLYGLSININAPS